jgi:hypothetical protein
VYIQCVELLILLSLRPILVSEKADHFKELAQSYDFSPYDA